MSTNAPTTPNPGAVRGKEPRPILKLEEVVINRIAAGEVVQRPANAVKELMENSLDAGATSITVTAKQGGLKLLQIQDNGHGIRREDLPIVCERFTTSKLREFNDLRNMSTFGFRGEALASITHTARVTITSKTPSSRVAYKAKYCDGKLVPSGPGQSADPKPFAGLTGTTVLRFKYEKIAACPPLLMRPPVKAGLAEDLFYNMETRRRAFKNASEQHRGIVEVVTRYAIHFGDRGISFTCKKHGQPSPDIHTPAKSSRLGNIKVAYGPTIARELIELQCASCENLLDGAEAEGTDVGRGTGRPVFRAKGFISSANYSSKRSDFILFINDRLVESPSIKKAVEAAYKDVLPKHTHPFVYLGITLPRSHVDVNVHPTKREVHFLHEEELLEELNGAVKEKLAGANQSRTFYSQVILPDMSIGLTATPEVSASGDAPAGRASSSVDSRRIGANTSRGVQPTPDDVDKETVAGGGDGDDDIFEANRRGGYRGGVLERREGGNKQGEGGSGGQKKPSIDLDEFSASRPSQVDVRAGGKNAPTVQQKKPVLVPQKLVRTDRMASSLDAFLRPSQPFFSDAGVSKRDGGRPGVDGDGRGPAGGGQGEADGDDLSIIAGVGGEVAKGKKKAKDVVASLGDTSSDEDEGGEDGGLTPKRGNPSDSSLVVDRNGVSSISSGNPSAADGLCVCSPDEDNGGDEDDSALEGDATGTGAGASGSKFDQSDGIGSRVDGAGGSTKRKKAGSGNDKGRSAKKRRAEGNMSKPFAGVGGSGGGRCGCCGGRQHRGVGGSIVLVQEDAPEGSPSSGVVDSQESEGGNGGGVPLSIPGSSESVSSEQDGDGGGAGSGHVARRAQTQHKRPATFVDTPCSYHSVRSLIGDFRAQTHKGLTQMLKKYTFVGMVDLHLSLVQFNTKLVLINHTELSKEAFFQMTLRRFGVMPRLPLSTSIPVLPLIRAALDLPEAAWTESDGDKDDLAEDACKLLGEKAAMLEEYFKVKVTHGDGDGDGDQGVDTDGGEGGAGRKGSSSTEASARKPSGKPSGKRGDRRELRLVSLPLLIEGHHPVPEGLPLFFLRLSTEVDWTEERTCFEGVAAELALYYSTLPEGGENDGLDGEGDAVPEGGSCPGKVAPEARDPSGDRESSKDSRREKVSLTPGTGPGAGPGAAAADKVEEALAPPAATAIVQYVMYPSFRWALLPPRVFATDGTVMQIACLERLYKVFERC